MLIKVILFYIKQNQINYIIDFHVSNGLIMQIHLSSLILPLIFQIIRSFLHIKKFHYLIMMVFAEVLMHSSDASLKAFIHYLEQIQMIVGKMKKLIILKTFFLNGRINKIL